MAPVRANAAWCLQLLLLLLWQRAEAAWLLGAGGASCTDACTNNGGLLCSEEGNRRLNDEYEMEYVVSINVSECTADQDGDPFRVVTSPSSQLYAVQPFQLSFEGLEKACYTYSQGSTCEASNLIAARICCCLTSAGADISTECFVPTTTSSTLTSSTTQTQTRTSTTSETITVTSTSSTSSTSVTITTSVTNTATSTSVTQTTSVTTSSTTSSSTTSSSTTSTTSTSVTSTLTTTSSTITTQTTTTVSTTTVSTTTVTITSFTSTLTTSTYTGTSMTMTTTSETTTSVTTATITTTTTTVTPRASSDITRDVLAGATEIAVDSTLGFSEGDMILIRNKEAVEILNITLEVRRLQELEEEEEDLVQGEEETDEEFEERRRLADNTIAILTVTPAVSRFYPAGTRILNAGPAVSYIGSDPITFYGGQKFKFWFPLHEELLMLQTPELEIYGQVFPGPSTGLQWFGHLRVQRTDGTPVARVRVKRDGSNQTLSRCASRKLDSLDVFLGTSSSPLRELRSRPMEFVAGTDVRFEINCRQQDRPQLTSSRTEYLHFETPSIAFLIVAAHAGNEFPNDPQLALKYKHLDFLILEMPRKETFSGVLPEIWGLLPRSPAVEAMLVPPEPEMQVCPSGAPDAAHVCASA